ncbi:thermostable beta-glucosidase B, putative [Entamoeba dispar SAW760]|uniref:beta-glucosidase n=1 Tax=Entamoeba dispar (strain ATCC PRA-260 / SAW760) TaxID=370354 RepID=B0EGR1_ENTDS|nr:thermostable beta-glucosidase B, putative [Entamoeba dispar SAW760]EDR26283.1 thermostable beta-glucosidase B, putative [Entamoeba dispar SAW760]|eukprot:EDR26283.1 thermostable beta-glucosidase B, putative [Entamoeba dispar SAW760]
MNQLPQDNSHKLPHEYLTLEQKLRLMIGEYICLMNPFKFFPSLTEIKSCVWASGSMTYPITGISPPINLCDGPSGLRIGSKLFIKNSTSFPSATCIAATFNKDMAMIEGEAIGSECVNKSIGVLLAPAINIQRHPLAGRNYECYSEDPLLAGEMGASYIIGVQKNGVAACVKHFVANNQETQREEINVEISQRALREIYVEAFRIALQGNPMTLMTSYNKVNGQYVGENEEMKMLLREDLRYNGIIMTDWYACKDTVRMVLGGNNLIEPGKPSNYTELFEEIKKGNDKLMKEIDESVDRIIEFTNSIKPIKQMIDYTNVALSVAEEGCVLLKNNQCLPIKESSKICLIGSASYGPFAFGIGSGQSNPSRVISIKEGLLAQGMFIDKPVERIYSQHVYQQNKRSVDTYMGVFNLFKDYEELLFEKRWGIRCSQECDIAVFTIGRICGEFYDRTLQSFFLQPNEINTIKCVSEIFHSVNKKVIIVLNIGGVIEIESWKDLVDGIIVCWINGEQCGNAVASILSGHTNPSGRLPTTFPITLNQPNLQSFPGDDLIKPTKVIYKEDIYVGYRYYTTFNQKCSYPFGYGLSYTQFEYSNFNVSVDLEHQLIHFTVTVTNTGTFEGKEVIQIYVSIPEDRLEHPSIELKAFGKTKLLFPNENQQLSFTRTFRDLSSFDTDSACWIIEKGVYTAFVSKDCLTHVLSKTFSITQTIIVKQSHLYAMPITQFNCLSKNSLQ